MGGSQSSGWSNHGDLAYLKFKKCSPGELCHGLWLIDSELSLILTIIESMFELRTLSWTEMTAKVTKQRFFIYCQFFWRPDEESCFYNTEIGFINQIFISESQIIATSDSKLYFVMNFNAKSARTIIFIIIRKIRLGPGHWGTTRQL